jgi:deoxycytidylate deaminase
MKMANELAERSHHSKHKVGCVITSVDYSQVHSVGYNGYYSGGKNKLKDKAPGKSEFVHAELNALIKNKGSRSEPKILFTTLSPCYLCTQCIINSKEIVQVYYQKEYRDKRGIKLLNKLGIKCAQIKSR